ncbi:hypothetical protein BFJ68_g7489 [Fusarium oxysporum]|uniref:BZIP domain-containing protein n=1 Tax=Fusarium oxysporum TaxID=5507 RepID=A0A420R7V7_FUSOX|nr:hypothetical protein BFJ68_g7489 [Fusarium oxysporum]
MTGGKKEGSTNPSAVRIRDNQRRSRARHKEYVEGLQKKLQDYERRGVEATLEMQQAARSVAVENSRLKILLGYHGITNEDVEKFLQSFPDQPASEAAKATISQSTSGQPLLAAAPKIPLQPLSRGHSAEPPRSTLRPPHIAPEKTSTRDVVDAVVGIKRDSRKVGLPSGPTLPLPVEQRQPLLQPRPQPPILPALPALVLGQGSFAFVSFLHVQRGCTRLMSMVLNLGSEPKTERNGSNAAIKQTLTPNTCIGRVSIHD